MLERITDICGIGLLHDANGKPHTWRKATLIYGDNGRGKSTLATVLRSLSTGNASLITQRKTLDGSLQPKVTLHFANGHQVSFAAGAWSEQRTEVIVFDADFIERNVHSGGTVNTNQRKNLLEFALGEPAVAARVTVEKATNAAKKAAEVAQSLISQISELHPGTTLAQFEALEAKHDANTRLAALQNQINAAGNISIISAKTVPAVLPEPVFDLAGVFAILGMSLQDVHADAESVVKAHLVKLASKDAEDWLSQGLQFGDGTTCPYCDQALNDNDLIKAYQTHFNASYAELKSKVAALHTKIATGTSTTSIDSMTQSIAISVAQASAWAEHVQIEPITFTPVPAVKSFQILRDWMNELAHQKLSSPTDAIGTPDDLAKARLLWDAALAPLRDANVAIKAAGELINDYQGKLASTSTTALQQQIVQIQIAVRRHQPSAVDLIAQLATARNAADVAEVFKKKSRETLDALMKATLSKYEKSINALLTKFGASFSIEGMDTNFRGGAPRSEYGLQLRGKAVPLEGGPPSFATALSEGDKRTLAFAFFIASTLADAKLSTQTVVIDDPMCSLDVNRKQHTKVVLKNLYAGAAQLVVLAHDPYFLRDLRDVLLKADSATPISLFQLVLAASDYTSFGIIDIDKECESPYFQHHRLLNDFCAGVSCNNREVAKAVRPVLEGYLHRRFPGLVPKSLMFGEVVIRIRVATLPSPLVYAQNLVVELNEINEYAVRFHHDTNPGGAEIVAVVASELKTFATRALHVVHRGEAMA